MHAAILDASTKNNGTLKIALKLKVKAQGHVCPFLFDLWK